VLSVGNADAIHLRLASGHYLIDTADQVAAGRVVVPYLRSQGINSLRGVFITHTHADHVGGLPRILGALPVALVYSGPEVQVVQDMAGKTPVLELAPNFRMENPKFSIRTLMLDQPGLNLNNRSAVLVLEHGNLTALFAADLEQEGEALLLPYLPSSQVLKVGHHGSNTSTRQAFLSQAGPEVSVISTGKNRFGHPSDEVISSLLASGSTVYRTDHNGAVRIRVKGNKLVVETFAQGKFRVVETFRTDGVPGRPVSYRWHGEAAAAGVFQ
jgi:competence protein ComEC